MKESTAHGLEFGTVLFLIFLVLKLTHNIDWSWWWVTCPLWLPIAIVGVIGLGCAFMVFITTAVIAKSDGKK